ncbi:hypothetical protein K438DRAFT_996103 [Mycena galopus ATCC 62051]|nr:hypothetical protein K438DRAFT_996103 [Mycena galopus ATCC 62051]
MVIPSVFLISLLRKHNLRGALEPSAFSAMIVLSPSALSIFGICGAAFAFVVVWIVFWGILGWLAIYILSSVSSHNLAFSLRPRFLLPVWTKLQHYWQQFLWPQHVFCVTFTQLFVRPSTPGAKTFLYSLYQAVMTVTTHNAPKFSCFNRMNFVVFLSYTTNLQIVLRTFLG